MTEVNNTYMCAVSNPKEHKYKSWFYNVFLGRQNVEKNKPNRNEIKVNWIFPSLTKEDIKLLQEKTCRVINLSEDIEIEIIEDEDDILVFKEGFEILLGLIKNLSDKKTLKEEINKYLYDSKGYPNKNLTKIEECEKLLKRYNLVIN